jgi:hypothetical protein
MYVCMYVCTYVRMYVCMCVCVCTWGAVVYTSPQILRVELVFTCDVSVWEWI